ncbi:hypothetical protein ES707_10450 [subsurface metagenome]
MDFPNPPKSLTAIVHIKFHYKDLEAGPIAEGEVEIISRILGQASELPPDLQEILVKFAGYLNHLSGGKGKQSPKS